MKLPSRIRRTPGPVWFIMISLLGAALPACPAAEPAAPPTWETKPAIAGIITTVPPLKHPLGNFHPTLFWWQAPLSFNDPGKLKTELRALSARGLLPCIGLEAEPNVDPKTIAQRIAEARAVAAAGFPVHLQMIGVLDLYLLNGQRVRHADAPGAGQKDAIGQEFPCLVLQDGWQARAKYIGSLLQQFADARVPVAAVWYDYEGHPHPWNGIFEHSQQCPSCRKAFPPGVLDDRNAFAAWAFDWHAAALQTAFAQPVRDVFPKASVGFYNYTLSSDPYPVYGTTGLRLPPSRQNPAEIDVVMPVCYANPAQFARRYYNADWPISAQEMEGLQFCCLLRAASNLHHNLRPNQRLMPFVSSYIASPESARLPRMSKPLYREFLRHAILRGARGFYCFNVAPPYGAMPDYYAELVDINLVYNELLEHREFFEGGLVLNDDWPDPKSATFAWSGIRKGNRALVRIVTLQTTSQPVEIVPFPGVAVKLLAQPAGVTYLVDASGKVRAVE